MINPLYDRLFRPHEGKTTPFLRFLDGTEMRYQDFLSLVSRLAHVLTEKGLVPGDRVAVQVHKSAQALALYGAAVKAGLVFLPLNTAYTAHEITYFVEDSGARLLVCDSADIKTYQSIFSDHDMEMLSLDADGSGTLMDQVSLMDADFHPVPRDKEDLVAILYTSGTTGRSKGAMLTQNNLLSNALSLAEAWRFTDQDVLLHALPIFHTHGLFVATNIVLATSGSILFLPKFDLDAIMTLIPKATTMMGVPTFYTRMLEDQRLTQEMTAHIRLFVSGSAPLLAESHRQFSARTGHAILERYGMTETNMNTSNPYDGERRPGTVGFPLPGVELKITDPEQGTMMPQGEVGQIELRGPNVFKGYWQMPEKTATELRPDGFFITGDLGRIDADGYLHIVGRNKDLIISGGYNIYPKEIELILDDQPGVLESAVLGVPHPDLGETVLGVIVAVPGQTPDLDHIAATAASALARFKQPRKLILIDELPRNTMGKVQKNILRERYKDVFLDD
jgi:malonyl-CoA/methylmalonyl-CoA synthetase